MLDPVQYVLKIDLSPPNEIKATSNRRFKAIQGGSRVRDIIGKGRGLKPRLKRFITREEKRFKTTCVAFNMQYLQVDASALFIFNSLLFLRFI